MRGKKLINSELDSLTLIWYSVIERALKDVEIWERGGNKYKNTIKPTARDYVTAKNFLIMNHINV